MEHKPGQQTGSTAYKKATLLTVTIAFASLVLVYHLRPKQHVPVPLIDGILSGQSFSQIQGLTRFRTHEWRTMETDSFRKSQNGPKYTILRVMTPDYVSLGITGTLELYFINDRLSECSFTPTSMREYEKRLAILNGPNNYDTITKPIFRDRGARVLRGDTFIMWVDPVLDREEYD